MRADRIGTSQSGLGKVEVGHNRPVRSRRLYFVGQLAATNLVVIETEHQVLDKEGRRSVNVNGPGRGVILQEGKSQQITWERNDGMIRAFANGSEIPLLAGTTWVQIVPIGTKFVLE
ncbi:DUF3048 C-terminal domain-containing protein [Paenibacillus sp. KN14-4R]|uniref:DUF3048 C-terminal domain-containing protein n=1 Tax=Paenibacillus sp. KN14-4R TaxID=3445773 RepID=UPI003F9FBD01